MAKKIEINLIPHTCRYLQKFISSHHEDYFERMNEYQPGKGYGYYPLDSEVTQHFRDIVHNLDESFKGVRIPEDFPSHVSLLSLIGNFKDFLLRKRKGLLKNAADYHVKKRNSVPIPVIEAERMTDEVIEALDHAQKIAGQELASDVSIDGETQSDRSLLAALCRFEEYISQVTKKSRKGRAPVSKAPRDEYDIQAHLGAVLSVLEDDFKAEEWTPQYLGGSSRVDFLIPRLETVIECKMTRKGLSNRELGDQLLVDVARYSRHRKCKKLVYFIYDSKKIVQNRKAFLADCAAASTAKVQVIPILCR